MSTPYVGEIRIFSFPRIPTGWFACDGSLKSISQYQTLFTLLGTTYGGDGVSTFGVPDLRGRAPIHNGNGMGLTPRVAGQLYGTESVTLLPAQMPQHNHSFTVNQANATSATPGSNMMPASVANNTPADVWYYPPAPSPMPTAGTLASAAVTNQGQSQPHDNCMPSLTMSFCIAWAGIFPSRN